MTDQQPETWIALKVGCLECWGGNGDHEGVTTLLGHAPTADEAMALCGPDLRWIEDHGPIYAHPSTDVEYVVVEINGGRR